MKQQNLSIKTHNQNNSYQEEDFCIVFNPPISAQELLMELEENE